VAFCCHICGCELEGRKTEKGNYPGIGAPGVHHDCNGLCIIRGTKCGICCHSRVGTVEEFDGNVDVWSIWTAWD
jgi:hypothetical protein